MDENFKAPASRVEDYGPEELSVRIRANWFNAVIIPVGMIAVWRWASALDHAFTALECVAALLLSGLLAVPNVFLLLPGRTRLAPLWLEAFPYCIIAFCLAATLVGYAWLGMLAYAALLPGLTGCAIAIFIAERRDGLRAYQTARKVVFVSRRTGLIV